MPLNLGGVLTDLTSTFAPQPTQPFTFPVLPANELNARDVTVADFNNDGWDDVAFGLTGNQGTWGLVNQRADPNGNWRALLDRTPTLMIASQQAYCSISSGDVNNDPFQAG